MMTIGPQTESESRESAAVRILLVEDERLVAISLKRQLSALGYEVVGHAVSGREAIEKADQLRPDLVLMDICLEGDMDGVRAAAEIHNQCQLPVIYLTAFSNIEILARAKVTEPVGYILKPYEDRELHVVIETALYRHRAERERSARRNDHRLMIENLGAASQLTPREAEVMDLIVSGKSQKQIAAELGITIQTAAKHRAKVLEKLDVANDVELVRRSLAIHPQAPSA
jgi:DNA-binding NarL/FixJ family response regulator